MFVRFSRRLTPSLYQNWLDRGGEKIAGQDDEQQKQEQFEEIPEARGENGKERGEREKKKKKRQSGKVIMMYEALANGHEHGSPNQVPACAEVIFFLFKSNLVEDALTDDKNGNRRSSPAGR